MVQMLAGRITYILLAIYCHDHNNENVSVRRMREISINIRNEMSFEDIVSQLPPPEVVACCGGLPL
jgi:hypothetical protein